MLDRHYVYEEMNGLSDTETQETLEKVDVIKMIVESAEPKKQNGKRLSLF